MDETDVVESAYDGFASDLTKTIILAAAATVVKILVVHLYQKAKLARQDRISAELAQKALNEA